MFTTIVFIIQTFVTSEIKESCYMMCPWWRQREYRYRYTVKDDGISQVEVLLYRQGIEKSVIWLYLFAEVRGRDRGQQYEPPYCFYRIPPQIKIFTKSSHPKIPIKFPTQTNPTIRKI